MSTRVLTQISSEAVEVPTAQEFDELKQKVDEFPTGNASVKERPWEVVVTEGYNDNAVEAAMNEVMSDRRGNTLQKRLVLPPGDFRLTKPLIESDISNTTMLEGMTIVGQGKRVTRVFVDSVYDASDDPWKNNFITSSRRLRFFTLEGLTAVSSSANNNFAYLWSKAGGSYNQRWNIRDVEFQGPWRRVIGLDGPEDANLNSEIEMYGVETATNSEFGDAFFRSGGISGRYNQQNQFLNYWFTNCNFTLRSGNVFRFDRGGSIRVKNGSWSAAERDKHNITWFYMPVQNLNNRSATQLSVRDVRFEPKSKDHLVIDCHWGSGSVLFQDCVDLSSIQGDYSKEYNLHRYHGAKPWGFGIGPVVSYERHQGAGYHSWNGSKQERGNFHYKQCYFFNGTSGQKIAGTKALRWTDGAPKYKFEMCDNVDDIAG